jgi:hypothetical protein
MTINLVQGPWWEPAAHLVYLAYDVAVSADFQEETARRLYDRATVFGSVCLCTKRPNRYPAAYYELRVVPSLGFTRDQYPPTGAAGLGFGRALIDDHNPWRSASAWVSWESNAKTPEALADALWHEWGHIYGWGYDHLGGNHPDNPLALKIIRRNVPLAAANAARYHQARSA